MLLAWGPGASKEIPFEEFCVYYAPQALPDATKEAVKSMIPIASQISTLLDAASEIDTAVEQIRDFYGLHRRYGSGRI